VHRDYSDRPISACRCKVCKLLRAKKVLESLELASALEKLVVLLRENAIIACIVFIPRIPGCDAARELCLNSCGTRKGSPSVDGTLERGSDALQITRKMGIAGSEVVERASKTGILAPNEAPALFQPL
jgi:hypothetical protein